MAISTTIKCNLCGAEFTRYDYNTAHAIHSVAGYGSDFDGSEIRIDICNHCFDDLIRRCRISPFVDPCDCEEDCELFDWLGVSATKEDV